MTMSIPSQAPSTMPPLRTRTAPVPAIALGAFASHVSVLPKVTRRNTYALRIRGNRMCDYNLFDGDVIIIHRRQHDAHQETAVATINQQEITLKQLSISRLGIHLCPQDTAMPAVFLHNCDMQVLGMVMGVEHNATGTQHH